MKTNRVFQRRMGIRIDGRAVTQRQAAAAAGIHLNLWQRAEGGECPRLSLERARLVQAVVGGRLEELFPPSERVIEARRRGEDLRARSEVAA